MSTTIEDRVILLLRNESQDSSLESGEHVGIIEKIKLSWNDSTPKKGHGFWENLEQYTMISAQRWRKAYARRQRPTPDMIEALAQLFPSYAFWLATGITDAINGHIAPITAQIFPERTYVPSRESAEYFRKEIELFKKLFIENQVNVADDKERMYAAERTRPLAQWWDSPLSDTAYKIAASDEYSQLKLLWYEREEKRKKRLMDMTTTVKQSPSTANNKKDPFFGIDTRTQHQDLWDLFYKSKILDKSKYPSFYMSTTPESLTDEQLEYLSTMTSDNVKQYLKHYGEDADYVFPPTNGKITRVENMLMPDEIMRLKELIVEQRKNISDDKTS